MRTATFRRSTSSWVLVRAWAGLPAVSAVCSSTGRPASILLRSLKNTVRPCSICRPPEASGPVLTVRNPTRMGPACAGAAGTLSTCEATPAASAPLMTARRLTVIAFLLWDRFCCRLNDVVAAGSARGSRLEIFISGPRLAIVDGVLQEFVGIIGPELAQIGIGLDHGVDQLAALLLDLADIDVADHVAVLVEAHGTARRLDLVACAQSRHQRVLVL